MNIDYIKLLEQEPEAKEFVKDVLLKTFSADKNGNQMLASIHTFYQMGMSVNDVVTWIKTMQRTQDDQ